MTNIEKIEVVFRCNASNSIGGGHIYRCLTFADTIIQQLNWNCIFIIDEGGLDIVSNLKSSQHTIFEIPKKEIQNVEYLISILPSGCKWLIVDHYELSKSWEMACSVWAENIFVIDDIPKREHACNILMDSSILRIRDHYSKLVPSETSTLFGPEYALLRPEFFYKRKESIDRRKSPHLKQILISFGATDRFGLSLIALKAVIESKLNLKVDLVLPAKHKDLKKIKDVINNTDISINYYFNVNNMAELMCKADLAIGALGISSWERCCLGLPTLAIASSDNQEDNQLGLLKYGAIKVVNGEKKDLIDIITNKLVNLSNRDLENMSLNASKLSQGLGRFRLVAELSPPISKDGKIIRLRRANINDMDVLYLWQTNSKTRRFFHNSDIPNYDEHKKWFKEKLNMVDCFFEIILHGEIPAGVVQLDKVSEDSYKVSLYIAPDKYGLGLAKAGFELIKNLVPDYKILAYVHEDNVAIKNILLFSGYKKSKKDLYILFPSNNN